MISKWATEWLVALGNVPAALTISLFSVWVLVGLFYYLNRYTRRGYFNLWTCSWVFYALWLTLQMHPEEKQDSLLSFLKYSCICSSATYLLWGSFVFLKRRFQKRWVKAMLFGLLLWSGIVVWGLRDSTVGAFSIFSLAGLASMAAGLSFWQVYRRDEHLGAGLVIAGFLVWGVYLVSIPWVQRSEPWAVLGYVVSAATQLFIAVSMVILVMEETRASKDSALHQIRSHKEAKDILEAKYQVLFQNTNEGILVANAATLRIVELNPEAQRLLGISLLEAREQALPSFFHASPEAGAPPTESAAWVDWVGQQTKLHLVCHDGGMVPVLVHGTPIHHEGQAAYQFFVQELTEWARLNRQLRQSEKLAALGRMISGIAHELNNPLAIIKGYLDLIMARHELSEVTRNDLLKVSRESDRAAKLVSRFLAFTRGEPDQREAVNFNELVCYLVELRQFEFRHADVASALDLAPDLPTTRANVDQMKQILVNLITNALQAMEEVPGPRHLTVRTRGGDGQIQIAVEDNGPGIPEDLANKIFAPYFTTKGEGKGTGLGLSISHRIVAEHRGRLFHEKSPEGGARFVIELPLVETPKEPTSAPPADPPMTVAFAGQTMPANILVVDDETSIAELLGESLTLLGYSSTLCSFAPRALELIANNDYDLVLSDMRMPVLDGRQLYQLALQKKPALKHRFVFLTGDTVNDETLSFLKSVGNVYLSKPFQLAKVEQVIAQVLHEHPPISLSKNADQPASATLLKKR